MVSRRDMTTSVRVIMWTFLAIVVMSEMSVVSGRYLPTRSQDDRIDRLRELLKDLLENQGEFRGISSTGGEGNLEGGAGSYAGIGGAGGPHTVMFKRHAPSMTFNPGNNYLTK